MTQSSLTTVNSRLPGRQPEFNAETQRKWAPDITEDDFWEITEYCWPYTVCGVTTLYNYYAALKYVMSQKIKGDIVECGVFLGGSVMFAARLLKAMESDRSLYALDTFYGFTANNPELDRDYSGAVICNPTNPNNDFSAASIGNMNHPEYAHLKVVKGDVLETIPRLSQEPIAVLRLDTDTYETTKVELEHLYPRVSSGGVVIIDDYGFNVGCAKAVDEYAADKRILFTRFDRWGRSGVKP